MESDINTKNTQWGCRTNYPHGKTFKTLANSQNFKILAPFSPTDWLTSYKNRPDVLDIFTIKILNSLNILTTNLDDFCSDHLSVFLTIDNVPLNKPRKSSLNNCQMD